MKTGFRGTFVISWSQTEVDGLRAAPCEALSVGAAWSWHGDPVRVDGPSDVLRLDQTGDAAAVRRGAARKVRQLVGAALSDRADPKEIDVQDPLFETGFVVSDGRRSFAITAIEVGPAKPPLLMFVDQLPPQNTDLWVVHNNPGPTRRRLTNAASGVICFTPGTAIDTPDGPRRVETLTEGDRVQTRDNGPQDILWIGQRRITGARMFVMPELRPIRLSAGALGADRPDAELLVSPQHRLLVRSRAAQALFNTPEVLIPAHELINGDTVKVDRTLPSVTYIHLLLSNHQILWANGLETESFHPASADLNALTEADRDRLFELDPNLATDPAGYGAFARRALSKPEVAILMHDAA